MTTDPQKPTRHVPVDEVISHHEASTPERLRSEPGAEQKSVLTIVTFPSRPSRSRLPLLIGIMFILLMGGGGVWYWLASGTPPIHYKTLPVERGPITAIATATGTINPVVSVQVGSQISGKVAQLFADFNSKVTKGQVLAQIDQKPFKARLSQARAAVKSARGNLSRANVLAIQRKREFDRMAALRPQAFVSQADTDLAETNYRDAAANVEVLQAQLDQAQAALASAELDLGYTTIYSPVDGIVVSRNVDVGQTLAAAFQTPILFLIAQDLTHMQVNANVSESDIGGVKEGTEANFRVDAYPKQFFDGVVTQVRNAPINIQNVVTYDVVITVRNPELKLKPGMTANVTIVTARKENPLRVPNGALRFRMPNVPTDRKVSRVWVLDPHHQPRQVDVSTGIADSLYTEIVSDTLREGDPVILGVETDEEQSKKQLPPGFEPSRGLR
ncbi:efflux RND transporter periplasmic adaptor subunit [Nitrospira sp. BLG_1]|uniref:efflux RND transporter periplasmic adaptor subunit n=1 Tax=Nitrospira sp. BLG_1 TaxID=3395883 RepID=UPI0039BD4A1F